MSEIGETKRDNLHSAIMNIPVESHQATNRDYKIGHRAALHAAAELVSEFVSKLPVSPSWQDRPTGPGLWVVTGMNGVFIEDVRATDINWHYMHGWSNVRVFGPIPADESKPAEGTEQK